MFCLLGITWNSSTIIMPTIRRILICILPIVVRTVDEKKIACIIVHRSWWTNCSDSASDAMLMPPCAASCAIYKIRKKWKENNSISVENEANESEHAIEKLTDSYLFSSREIKLRKSVIFASTVKLPTRYSRCLLAIWRKFVTRNSSAGDSSARNIWNENITKLNIKWMFVDCRLLTTDCFECHCSFNWKWFKIQNHQKIISGFHEKLKYFDDIIFKNLNNKQQAFCTMNANNWVKIGISESFHWIHKI